MKEETLVKPQILRDKKGRIVKPIPQDTNKNGTAGNPNFICKYCTNKEKYQKIADDYLNQIKGSVKKEVPWIEELALLLDVDDSTLTRWATKEENGVLEHPELHTAYLSLKSIQKLRLKQRALGRFNPHGALYLLNADHKVIQTTKEVVTGDVNEPMHIIITESNE